MTLVVVANGGNGCFVSGEKPKGPWQPVCLVCGIKTRRPGKDHSKHQNVNTTNMMPRISIQQEDSEETCNLAVRLRIQTAWIYECSMLVCAPKTGTVFMKIPRGSNRWRHHKKVWISHYSQFIPSQCVATFSSKHLLNAEPIGRPHLCWWSHHSPNQIVGIMTWKVKSVRGETPSSQSSHEPFHKTLWETNLWTLSMILVQPSFHIFPLLLSDTLAQ